MNCIVGLLLLSFSSLRTSPLRPSPRIYVYNLSSIFTSNMGPDGKERQPRPIYSSEILFPTLLLQSPHRENDPEQADYFYVHSYFYHTSHRNASRTSPSSLQSAFRSDLGHSRMSAILSELKSLGPYFQRKGGRDHIFAFSFDCGFCHCPVPPMVPNAAPLVKDSIILQHWGALSGSHPHHGHGKSTNSILCDLDSNFRSCPPDVFPAPTAIDLISPALPPPPPPPPPCYVPHKDLLIPFFANEESLDRYSRHLNKSIDYERDSLLFFGGSIHMMRYKTLTNGSKVQKPSPWYSDGVRQTIFRLYANHSRFKWAEKPPHPTLSTEADKRTYYETMARSVFCLATTGVGWGSRTKSAILHGCIPLIISDGVKVEWEDDLPYEEFAVRFPFSWSFQLPEILEQMIDNGMAAKMIGRIECIWPLFLWSRPRGKAFDFTMCVLESRLHNWSRPRLNFTSCSVQCSPGSESWPIHT